MSSPRFVYDEATQENPEWVQGTLLNARNAAKYTKSAHPILGEAYKFWRTEQDIEFKSFSNTEDLLEYLLENITTKPPQYAELIKQAKKFCSQYKKNNKYSLEDTDIDTIEFIKGFIVENKKETYIYLITQLPEIVLEKLLYSIGGIDNSTIKYTTNKNNYFGDIVTKFALEIWEKVSLGDGFSVGETLYLCKSAVDAANPMPLEVQDLRSYLQSDLRGPKPAARLG